MQVVSYSQLCAHTIKNLSTIQLTQIEASSCLHLSEIAFQNMFHVAQERVL